ncbi:MAG TPA: VOC family protein [Solirubrobacteraceae bacterium]|nr:VOC family protein [Solirubrobacteraceae bacterium]
MPRSYGVTPTTQEDAVSTSTSTKVEKISTVIIPVADLDGQIDFYVEKLGFEKRVDIPFADDKYRWVEVGPAGAETTIALAPPPPHKPETGNRETGISLYAANIDAYHDQLRAAGVDVDDEISRMGDPVPPMFWLRDPEGNSLMVIG